MNIQYFRIRLKYLFLFISIFTAFQTFSQIKTEFKFVDSSYELINFLEYKDNKQTFSELSQKLAVHFQDNPTDTVSLISRITIDSKNGSYLIFKTKNLITQKTMSFVFKDNILQNNYPACFSVLGKLKIRSFFEFYSVTNNPEFPEINNLKILVKDGSGILNICSLSDIIEKNKVLLAKHIED